MRTKIVTHPDNVELIKKTLHQKELKEYPPEFCHYIQPFGFDIVANPNMEKDRWTGKWKTVWKDKYFTAWDETGEPPSWAVYFGFVVKIMEPLFYEIETPRFIATGMFPPMLLGNKHSVLKYTA